MNSPNTAKSAGFRVSNEAMFALLNVPASKVSSTLLPRVEPVRHTRPPSMSSYHSSRVPSGFSIRPKSSGGKSRALRPLPLAFVNRAFRTKRSSSANSSVEN